VATASVGVCVCAKDDQFDQGFCLELTHALGVNQLE
jgi:hypothetical protein